MLSWLANTEASQHAPTALLLHHSILLCLYAVTRSTNLPWVAVYRHMLSCKRHSQYHLCNFGLY